MNHFDLTWAPEGKPIGTVFAKDASAARRKAPLPYRKYPGEIVVVPMPTVQQGLETLLSLATDDRMKVYGQDGTTYYIQGVPAGESDQGTQHYRDILTNAGWVIGEVRQGYNPMTGGSGQSVRLTLHHRTLLLRGG